MTMLGRLLERLVPAVLLASGVTLLMAGLLSYAPPATFGDQSPEPTFVAGDPAFTPGPEVTPDPADTPSALPVLPSPTPSRSPTEGPTAGPTGP
ncbi:MAG: hypothetical protein M3253_01620, partial [Chloroflexota bacterium]|nr:hypothetical protein [Chloroflexota bacterium]